jgi:uncharacterized membrane protein
MTPVPISNLDSPDRKLEHLLARLLRIGVFLAAGVVFLGGIAYLKERGLGQPRQQVFHEEPPELRNPLGIIRSALDFESRGLIQLGLLLLIATPIARVVFSLFAFALQRDRTYVIVTLIVLAVLVFSLVGSLP